jgi:outer membrane protein OmpA-like peptidoglycan-associated protein
MLSSGSGGQPRGARGLVQADCAPESGTSGLRCRRAPWLALLLAGCSSFPASMNPVSWWHDLQGGKIAEERPPPPGADQPYPNLASVPPKPEAPDRAALANIATALIADRTNAQHAAAAAPIADPSLPSASPALFGRGTVPPPSPPPPGTGQASATMAAADAPPAKASPSPPASAPEAVPAPAKAPLGTVQSAPLAPPGATAQLPADAAVPPPALPTAPPPPPRLSDGGSTAPAPVTAPSAPPESPPAPGVAAPVAAPPPPAVPTPTPVAPPQTNAASAVNVTFVNGSAALTPTATDTLKQLATRRGTGMIAVTGYGDAASNNPDAQSAALALGLSRAQAMAAALTAAGVPASAVQVDAAAIGRGATARLVQ